MSQIPYDYGGPPPSRSSGPGTKRTGSPGKRVKELRTLGPLLRAEGGLGPLTHRPSLGPTGSSPRQLATAADVERVVTPRGIAADNAERGNLGDDILDITPGQAHNGARRLENGSPVNQINNTALPKGSAKWTGVEITMLKGLVQRYTSNRATKWSEVEKGWDTLIRQGVALNPRSKYALQSKLAALKKEANEERERTVAIQNTYTERNVPVIEPLSEQEVSENGANIIEVVNTPPNDDPDSDPDEEPLVHQEDEEDPYEEFRRQFHRFYRRAYGSTDRDQLKKPPKAIPSLLMLWGDRLIEGIMSDDNKRIDKLNAAVYAVGRTILWQMEKEYRTTHPIIGGGWKNELENRIKILKQDIDQLKKEIGRRIKRAPFKKGGLKSMKYLQKKYQIKETKEFKAVEHNLGLRLANLEHKLAVKLEENGRKRIRRLPPKKALQPPKEDVDIPVEDTRNYWATIIGTQQEFSPCNELREWAGQIEISLPNNQDDDILFSEVLSKARPWKAPGPDGIHNFWWKHLSSARKYIGTWTLAIKRQEIRPSRWISTGRIVLLSKGGDPLEASNYRPIACLNTCYKILTGMITRWIRPFIERVLPLEQMALKKEVRGCTQAHVIDQVVTTDAKYSDNNKLSIGWLDFQKAFDSIKHKCIRWKLKKIGVPEPIRHLIKVLMGSWKIRYEGRANGKKVRSTPLQVKNGLLQGDTLSPLLFCLSIASISWWLNQKVAKYKTSMGRCNGYPLTLNHIYFVDDLKILTTSKRELNKAIEGVITIGSAIGLQINKKKCAIAHIRQKHTQAERTGLLSGIPLLGEQDTYKYLGIEQKTETSQKEVLKKLRDQISLKADNIWKSKLTYKQMVDNTNACILAKARYIFQNLIVGSGRFNELTAYAEKLDVLLRKKMSENDARQLTCCVDRLYVHRSNCGIGLKSFLDILEDSIISTSCYLILKPELLNSYQILYSLSFGRGKRTILRDLMAVITSDRYKQYNILGKLRVRPDQNYLAFDGQQHTNPTKAAQQICKTLETYRQMIYLQEWKLKPSLGRVLNTAGLDLTRSLRWISEGLVGGRVMGLVLAAQEGMLIFKAHIANTRRNDKLCRKPCHNMGESCERQLETIQHVTSICRYWRAGLMLKRHNAVAKCLHRYFSIKYEFKTVHYSKRPEYVLRNDNAIIYWDHSIPTNIPLKHNQPDIVVIDKKNKHGIIIEVRVSWPTIINQEERRKVLKYTVNSNLDEEVDINRPYPHGDNLLHEMQALYRGYTFEMVPIVIGVFGEVGENTYNNLRKIGIESRECERLLSYMSRSAAIGTYRILLAHLASPE